MNLRFTTRGVAESSQGVAYFRIPLLDRVEKRVPRRCTTRVPKVSDDLGKLRVPARHPFHGHRFIPGMEWLEMVTHTEQEVLHSSFDTPLRPLPPEPCGQPDIQCFQHSEFALQLSMQVKSVNILEKRVDEGRSGGASEDEDEAEDKKHYDDRDHPVLLVVLQHVHDLRYERLLLAVAFLIERVLGWFAHKCSSVLSQYFPKTA